MRAFAFPLMFSILLSLACLYFKSFFMVEYVKSIDACQFPFFPFWGLSSNARLTSRGEMTLGDKIGIECDGAVENDRKIYENAGKALNTYMYEHIGKYKKI